MGYCDRLVSHQSGGRHGFCSAHITKWKKYAEKLYAHFAQSKSLKKKRGGKFVGHEREQPLWTEIWKVLLEEAKNETQTQPPDHSRYIQKSNDERIFQAHICNVLHKKGHAVWQLSPNLQNTSGAPDLLIITASGKVLFRELKLDGGQLKPNQQLFRDRINQANGKICKVWTEEDYKHGIVEKEADE